MEVGKKFPLAVADRDKGSAISCTIYFLKLGDTKLAVKGGDKGSVKNAIKCYSPFRHMAVNNIELVRLLDEFPNCKKRVHFGKLDPQLSHRFRSFRDQFRTSF